MFCESATPLKPFSMGAIFENLTVGPWTLSSGTPPAWTLKVRGIAVCGREDNSLGDPLTESDFRRTPRGLRI